jgi:hypothetical protein
MTALSEPRRVMVPLGITLMVESVKRVWRPWFHDEIKCIWVVVYLISIQKFNNVGMGAYLEHTQLFTNCVLALRGVYSTELLDSNCSVCIGVLRLVNDAKTATPGWDSYDLFVWDIAALVVQPHVEGICGISQAFHPIRGEVSGAVSAIVD